MEKRSSVRRTRQGGQLRPLQRPADGRVQKENHRRTLRGLGRGAVNYRLRDWLFSRQHFWGEPFPIWHELDSEGKPTGLMRTDPEGELPVTLPDMRHFKPHGRPEPPLAEAPDSWLFKTAPTEQSGWRETNTMPQWAGLLVLPAVYRPAKRDRFRRSGQGKGLDAGRSLHRRRRARRAAPALFAVLAQGAVRPRARHNRRAVPQARQPGNDPRRSRTDGLSISDPARQPWVSYDDVEMREGQAFHRGTATGRLVHRGSSRRQVKKGSTSPGRINSESVRSKCRSRAATSSIPTTWSTSTGPTRCGCTKCSWARWKRRSPGA